MHIPDREAVDPFFHIQYEKEINTMKKILAIALVLILALANVSALAATTIKVGATPAPHAEILEICKEILAEQDIKLEIVQFNDYIIPNTAVESGQIDANYFQHVLYLGDFNAQNGTHLVIVEKVHYEPFGIYAGKTASLAELKEGAKIAVPNDGTNEARALLLLEAQGLIKLKEGVGLTATKLDIEENAKNFDIIEIEAAQLPRSLGSVDVAVINGNYAIDAGLKASDALAVEDGESEVIQQNYANVLVAKEGNETNEALLALAEALKSEQVKAFIEATYEGAVVPLF